MYKKQVVLKKNTDLFFPPAKKYTFSFKSPNVYRIGLAKRNKYIFNYVEKGTFCLLTVWIIG